MKCLAILVFFTLIILSSGANYGQDRGKRQSKDGNLIEKIDAILSRLDALERRIAALEANIAERDEAAKKSAETKTTSHGLNSGQRYADASAEQQAAFREWLRVKLQNGAVKLTFIKSDGSVREMLGTLDRKLIPTEYQPNNLDQKPSDYLQPVFDLELKQWRSFRFQRLTKVENEYQPN